MSLPPRLDGRLTPMRPDIAAASLRGRVEAERYVEGRVARVVAPVADMHERPRADAGLSTQLLHGEIVRVYDEDEGWAWVQAEHDGYVGYVPAEALGATADAGHRVVVSRTFVYPAPDMKRPILAALPLGARVVVTDRSGAFCRLSNGGYVWDAHLAAIDQPRDFVAIAESLLGVPYLWGGKSPLGIDCSGLVQLAAAMAGASLPRDTDLQQAAPEGRPINPHAQRSRGDLVFWRGHVGIMSDGATLVHASGHHMLVVREPAVAAEARIASSGSSVISVKRFPGLGAIAEAPDVHDIRNAISSSQHIAR